MPPAVNALRAPGQWQSSDIIYRGPIVRKGVVIDEGSMTVLVNGLVVQDSTLNIWYRELRPRLADGGTDGRLSKEGTKEKRAEIAADVRASAEQLQGHGRMMRLLEACMYDNDASEWEQCRTHVLAYVH